MSSGNEEEKKTEEETKPETPTEPENNPDKKLTQSEIETKLKDIFKGLSDSNITILGHYMYKNPSKWRSNDQYFTLDANKIAPEAFASNMRPSTVMFGIIIAVFVILLLGLLWWIISMFIQKNNKNVLNDPSVVNPVFI